MGGRGTQQETLRTPTEGKDRRIRGECLSSTLAGGKGDLEFSWTSPEALACSDPLEGWEAFEVV